MRTFFDSYHCRSHVHCRHCRDKLNGRPFRKSLRSRYSDIPRIDFECPHGLSWSQRAVRKRRCGEKRAGRADLFARIEALQGPPTDQLRWIKAMAAQIRHLLDMPPQPHQRRACYRHHLEAKLLHYWHLFNSPEYSPASRLP